MRADREDNKSHAVSERRVNMYIRKLTKQVICNLDEPIVRTKNGRLRGVLSEGTCIFRGIKYADAERFHMPQPVKPWEGIKDAIVYGFACPEIRTGVPGDQFLVPHYFCVQSEDCQYLNVWTQSLDSSTKRPVMVWLHGGGQTSGSGVEHYAYDGEELSRFGDVVVVTLNHRLNILGYLDLSEYGEEYRYSANAGMADIVAALRWIHENIACFGGDPDNVMIFGQSGGGAKVATLMGMPSADGLYHRVCLQSGGMGAESGATHEETKKLAEYVLEYLNIAPEDVHRIEEVGFEELAEASEFAVNKLRKELERRISWGPLPDGDLYLGHPCTTGFREETRNIPVLCGNVYAEFQNNFASPKGEGSKNTWSEEYTLQIMREEFGEKAKEVKKAFQKAYPDKPLADSVFCDKEGRASALDFARLRAGFTNAGTYNFLFHLESPFNGGTLAWHNSEIPYIFHNAQYIEASYVEGVTETLQDIMCGAWVQFARCGDPNHEGMPHWNAFTPDESATMVFDRKTELKIAHDAQLIEALPGRR